MPDPLKSPLIADLLLARRLDRVNMQDTTKGGVDFLLADPPRGSVARLLSLKHSIK